MAKIYNNVLLQKSLNGLVMKRSHDGNKEEGRGGKAWRRGGNNSTKQTQSFRGNGGGGQVGVNISSQRRQLGYFKEIGRGFIYSGYFL